MVESLNEGIWHIDADAHTTYVNHRMAEMLGYTINEMMDKHLFEFMDERGKEIANLNLKRREEGVREQHEFEFIRKNGERLYALLETAPMFDDAGSYVGAIAGIQDITNRRQAEEQNHLLAEMVDIAPNSITIHDFDGNMIYANRRTVEMHGFSEDEFMNMNLRELDVPESAEKIEERMKSIREDGEATFEVSHFRKDGSSFPLLVQAKKIELQDGRVVLMSIATDISERRQADEALRESEEKYRTLVTNTLLGVVIAQSQPVRVSFANPVMKTITGYDIEELLSMKEKELPVLIHPDDRLRFFGNFRKRIEGENIPVQDEYRVVCKDGTIKWMSIYSSLIDFLGEPATLTTFLDITERREAEQALKESEKLYRELFETSMDVVYLSTSEGKFVDINKAGEELFGYSKEEILMLDIQNLYSNPQDRAKFQRAISENGYVKNYELFLKKKDGSPINALTSATVRRDQAGEVIGYQGIMKDVTEIKRIQEQVAGAQKMEALGTLTGGIAHDFNNILSTIMGYSSFLKSKVDVNNDLFLGLDAIEKASLRASELTNQLLVYTRKGERTITTFNINRVITEVYDLIIKTFDKSIEIRLDTDKNIAPIDGDESQIYQVVMNLAVNSQQAMSKGGILILETFSRNVSSAIQKEYFEIPPGLYTCFKIVDTGVGMDEEIVSKVFEPYFTTKEDQGGSGLGMSVVYGIVKDHNGYIEVESEPGQGTMITACFPISGKAEGVARKPMLDVNGGSEKILIIDDEKEILGMMSSILRESGYTVYIAYSGKDGIDLYKEVRPDLVILDLKMPKMDGREVFRELIRINPNVKTLLSTGFVDAKEKDELINMGAKGFIKKPYTASDIKKKIKEIFR